MGIWGEKIFKRVILLPESKVFFLDKEQKIKMNHQTNEQTRSRDNRRGDLMHSIWDR